MPESNGDLAARRVLPYELVVGQAELKLALELAYVDPAIGGVLASGQRGTAKTTTVRAFAVMVAGELPVTLPIGATEDRVLGGWHIDKLMQGEAKPQQGLLVDAAESAAGMLYVDEINLLDDFLVNIILDVVSTGILDVQRENLAEPARRVEFTLVGTMNPEEGALRPQLLDRFALVAEANAVTDTADRARIIEAVLSFETGSDAGAGTTRAAELRTARTRVAGLPLGPHTIAACAAIAGAFELVGHRGELVLLRSARAYAALTGSPEVGVEHVKAVAKLALIHRRSRGETGTMPDWTEEDDKRVADAVAEWRN
ncbi:AAA family ATPase [Uniformispora flossi]|uniref:AAA family ATPase n=1 Tax=Uniformispora flossi TaxID=3390723 RepID=UPI003C2AF51C